MTTGGSDGGMILPGVSTRAGTLARITGEDQGAIVLVRTVADHNDQDGLGLGLQPADLLRGRQGVESQLADVLKRRHSGPRR